MSPWRNFFLLNLANFNIILRHVECRFILLTKLRVGLTAPIVLETLERTRESQRREGFFCISIRNVLSNGTLKPLHSIDGGLLYDAFTHSKLQTQSHHWLCWWALIDWLCLLLCAVLPGGSPWPGQIPVLLSGAWARAHTGQHANNSPVGPAQQSYTHYPGNSKHTLLYTIQNNTKTSSNLFGQEPNCLPIFANFFHDHDHDHWNCLHYTIICQTFYSQKPGSRSIELYYFLFWHFIILQCNKNEGPFLIKTRLLFA